MKLTSQLYPYSATFQPFASPPRTMPDISQLSFSDKASTVSDEFKVVSYCLRNKLLVDKANIFRRLPRVPLITAPPRNVSA
jgi:hypothetical protein